MTTLQKSAQEQLRQHIEKIERLAEEQKALAADIRDQFTVAKSQGFDVKAMRKILKLRQKSKTEREEEEGILEVYMAALGMLGTPLGDWAEQARSGDVGGITYEQRVDAVARAHGIDQSIADQVKENHAARGRKLYPEASA
jgi:uncharacterized protein (UPF0335 family)